LPGADDLGSPCGDFLDSALMADRWRFDRCLRRLRAGDGGQTRSALLERADNYKQLRNSAGWGIRQILLALRERIM
jgi:hypothetical protein